MNLLNLEKKEEFALVHKADNGEHMDPSFAKYSCHGEFCILSIWKL